jgi:DNA-binding transcriptional LysR family regulator
MIPALRNGELDLIVHYSHPTSPTEGLVCERLFDDEYVVCASVKHRLAEGSYFGRTRPGAMGIDRPRSFRTPAAA